MVIRAGGMVEYTQSLAKSLENDFEGWKIEKKEGEKELPVR